MPTDLTGTPTSLGIGTYNVDADAPSGLGFNAAMGQIDALIAARATVASPTFTGTPAAPTPTPGDVSTKIATTSFVSTAISGLAPLASPTFTGTPVAPTAAPGTNSTQIATTSFVATSFAPLASPALTGTPTAPTPATADNTTKIATTAFVKAQGYLTSVGTVVNTFNGRSGAVSPTSGDYTAAQVTNAADKASASNQAFAASLSAQTLIATEHTTSVIVGGSSLSPDYGTAGHYFANITAGSGTLNIVNPTTPPSGTQTAFLTIEIANSSGSTYTLAWGTAYVGSNFTLPGSIANGGHQALVFVWCPGDSKWRSVGMF